MFFFGHQGQDFLHVVNEAHVEHAVGFVEHQHLHGGQIELALLLQVEQTTRGSYQDVNAALNAVDLRVHANATKNNGGGELQIFAVGAHRFFHLCSKFACRGEHQSAHAVNTKFVFNAAAHGELVQHGQGEGGCFASAGLGAC